MDNKQLSNENVVVPELYFLISKFLAAGPLKETAKVLVKELEQKKVLPRRTDWLGNEHDQSFDELESKYSHIGANHLLEICARIGPILDNELTPAVPGIVSLLGSGRQSLMRTKDSIYKPRSLLDYCTRVHGVSLPDSAVSKPTHNLEKVLIGREYGGPVRRKLVIPTSLYGKTRLLRRTVGHLSSVYCVLFDRTGQYIITGADDLLIKIWSAIDGRLLATLRGASAEITDIAINLDNTMLAAGSLDRILRVWDLQTTSPIAVLSGHTGMITSVNFCPSPRGDLKYLVTTSTDGSIAFWQYTTPRAGKTIFAPKPIQYHEKLRPGQAQMMCTSFSPGGMFLAAGSADHHARVYIMSEDGPKRILETEAYTDAVDSVQWAHRGLKFISGSKDGTAHVWTFESQQWKSLKLNMTERLSTCPEPEEGKKLKVTMVAWDYSDKYVITAVNDFTIKIWHAKTGKLHCVLRGHKDELYVLESNPKDEYVLLSAGHDGQVFLWDIEQGISVAHFVNNIDGQGHGGVFDAKWSPDGTMIAATDSHGHILIFGLGIGPDRFKNLPTELFFHTDYRPLLRDTQHYVVDEQTQIMPHLMPPPFLVDVDGNPHPPAYQRLVPGRENCPTEQLVPNITMGMEGVEIDDNGGYSHIDRLIEALANRQGADPVPDSNNERQRNNSFNNGSGNSPRGAGSIGRALVAARRTGDVEGVRQSVGNWQRETNFKFIRRIYVRPMKYSQMQNLRQTVYAAGQYEMDQYKREMRRRPIMINTLNANTAMESSNRQRGIRSARRGPRPAYRTRAVRGQEHVEEPPEEEEEEEDSSNSSGDTSYSNVEENLSEEEESSTTDSESSDYSDWVADKPGPNLEPPKRSKRKPVARRSSSVSSDDTSQPNPSSIPSKNRRKRPILPENITGEIPEAYKPPEWLSEVIPRKTPYYPQMGDEVVYFRQGHQRYLDAVRSKKAYKLTHSSEPWNFRELREHELVRVIGIKYEIKPPRLCCLKLAMLNDEGNMSGSSFKIKYHDMPDVLDFLVLRQTFDLAVQRNWGIGDRFRCMIGDGWWMGQIESRHLLSPEYPSSYFMCFRVRWDNGEYEYMSPWDMEPIDENRLPDEVGGAVSVLPEEIRATLYQPKSEEWHRGDRDGSCRRIINGLEQVMRLSIAEPFLAPVDLNIYPNYAYLIEYPIDLTTIKARFENHFYRRITSAQFDVRYLATNAEKFNRKHTTIVRHARIITDLCLRIIREQNDIDVAPVYHQLVDIYVSSESENDNNENEPGPSTSTAGPSSSASRRNTSGSSTRNLHNRDDDSWQADCRKLLDMMWLRPDSTPFREPVDTMQFPDYLQIIDTPMDLRTVKEDLLGGNYEDPVDFAKDVRLIFQNSKNYNTNKRSRIYSMTLRLSALFESHIKKVISTWKAVRRRLNKSLNKRTPPDRSRNRSGPSRRAKTTTNGGRTNSRHHSSDDDDDADEETTQRHTSTGNGIQHRSSNRNRLPRNASNSHASTAFSSNRVTSSNQTESLPGPSGHNLRRNASRPNSQEVDGQSSDESSSMTSGSSSSSEDDSDSHDHNQGGEVNKFRSPKKSSSAGGPGPSCNRNRGNDSEDSYKPNERRKSTKRKAPKKKREAKSRRRIVSDDDDDEVDVVKARGRNKTKQTGTSNASPNKRSYRRKANTSEENNDQNSVDEDGPSGSTNQQTPKKKTGRSLKLSQQQPSTSAAAIAAVSVQPVENESPSRATRISNRRSAAETDHSYHLPVRNLRNVVVDSETDQEVPRPTRQSARRAIMEWARGSAEEDEDNDVEHGEENIHKRSRGNARVVKKTSDSSQEAGGSSVITNGGVLNLPSTSRAAVPTTSRQLRTNRNTNVVSEDDDESDNEPLASSQNSQRQRLDDLHGRPYTRNARLQPTTTGTRSTRSHTTTTNQDAIPSSSSSNLLRSTASISHQVQIDHNYGEPGPSSIRNTRRVLSRHQRNADELDLIEDPLEMSSIIGNVSSRLRLRNNVNSTTPQDLPQVVVVPRRGRSRYSQETSATEVDVEEEDDDDDDDEEEDGNTGVSDEGTDGGSKDSDSDDNQPLTSFVPARNTRPPPNRRPTVASATAVTNNNRNIRHIPQRRKRNINSDEDDDDPGFDDDDDDDDYQGGGSQQQRGSRNTRNQKRPRYNEESDDTADSRMRRRVPLRHSNGNTVAPPAAAAADSNDDEQVDSDNNEAVVSVSSRGRVRKISAKARGIFRD
ncbi:bromodomain and WD repeat-containing protein 3 [Episyrphus balteatus]|uniref:bromodomain and WD repeat-containing protein 3 n=1 Tax=Episyrphus balteatus TaxID=286459 RepID=UPI002486B02C|nr:bromodomain and WD repeat-containing protein 3 [Episyrphus balteatus]